MDKKLRKYCPNCQKSRHEKNAAYCSLCGVELKNEAKREFYLSLKIPDSKINIEENREKVFSGFPFFLRKVEGSSVQVILFHDYPYCTQLNKNIHERLGPISSEINMTDETLNIFLDKGFKWLHESELDTWY